MPMKIDVGVCKKIGLPDYGSAGSHCNVTLEADLSVLNDAVEFQRRVRHAYGLCRQAVEDELNGHHGTSSRTGPREETPQVPENPQPEQREPSGNNTVTEKQMQFITRLCRGIKGLDNRRLDAYCTQEFGKSSTQLSAQDASRLIDMLKDAKENGGLAT